MGAIKDHFSIFNIIRDFILYPWRKLIILKDSSWIINIRNLYSLDICYENSIINFLFLSFFVCDCGCDWMCAGKMKKLYSNKEIVAFDDEDEQHEQQPILAESPSMSPVLSRQQRTDTHTRKKVAFDRAQKQQQVVSDELIDMLLSELADEEDDDESQQYRAKKPSPYQDILPSLDYYEAAEDVEPESESQDLDQLIEDEMKLNELVKSLGLKSKSSSNHRVNNDENGEMFIRGGNNNNKIQNSPVNKVQVEEKLMLEKEYNDELKSRLKQQQQQDDKSMIDVRCSLIVLC